MGQIIGSTTALSGHFKYYIDWIEDQVNTTNNTSRVQAWVYVQKIGSYNVEGSQNSHTLYIDGTPFSANPYIDMNPETTPRLLVSGSKTITHNSDGSKSINISASGQVTYIPGAYYSPQGGSASATVALTTIPRHATISNSVNYTAGNNVPLTFSNSGGMYMKVRAYVWDGSDWEPYIKDQNMGNGTSGTFTFDAGQIQDIYDQIGASNLSAACKFRVYSYTGSDYSSGYIGYKDKDGTVSVDQAASKPVFTTISLANVPKDVEVRDSYNNLLDTSNTGTLLGSTDKMIKGISKVRATVAVANKMVAQNAATEDKYRFSTSLQQVEQSYSAVSDVTMDLDNVVNNSFTVTAFDSRSLSTAVNGSLSYIANYFNVNIFGLDLIRDNQVDSQTKLKFSGLLFNEYFGGGTSGVQNSITIEYRYKESTAAWGAQSWADITADAGITGNDISYEEYINGDLGVSGFDSEKSYSIQVRAYDKLSSIIVEKTLSRGIPLIHYTQNGLAINARYDTALGGELQARSMSIVDEIIKISDRVEKPIYPNPTNNSWANYSQPKDFSHPPATYFKDDSGLVHLTGLIRNGTLGANAFQLPASHSGYFTFLFAALSNSALGRVDATLISGSFNEVRPASPSVNAWVALERMVIPTSMKDAYFPSYSGSWVDYSSTNNSYAHPFVIKDKQGICWMFGMVKSGSGTIFNLPEEYRPAKQEIFGVIANAAIGRVDVSPNGNVDFNYGANNWVSLDGLSWMAADSPYQDQWVDLPLINNWVNYNDAAGQYQQGQYFIDYRDILHIRGLVKDGTDRYVTPTGYSSMFDCGTHKVRSGTYHYPSFQQGNQLCNIRVTSNYLDSYNYSQWISFGSVRTQLVKV